MYRMNSRQQQQMRRVISITLDESYVVESCSRSIEVNKQPPPSLLIDLVDENNDVAAAKKTTSTDVEKEKSSLPAASNLPSASSLVLKESQNTRSEEAEKVECDIRPASGSSTSDSVHVTPATTPTTNDDDKDNYVYVVTDDDDDIIELSSSVACLPINNQRLPSIGGAANKRRKQDCVQSDAKRFKCSASNSNSENSCKIIANNSEDVIVLDDSLRISEAEDGVKKDALRGCHQNSSKKNFKSKIKRKKRQRKLRDLMRRCVMMPKCYQPLETLNTSDAAGPNDETLPLADEPADKLDDGKSGRVGDDDEVILVSNVRLFRPSTSSRQTVGGYNSSSGTAQLMQWNRPAHFQPKLVDPPPKTATSSSSSYAAAAASSSSSSSSSSSKSPQKAPKPVEKAKSAFDVGSNVFIPADSLPAKTGQRPIFIDGCNVAFSHGRNRVFSVKGIEICVEYFDRLGNRAYVVLPNHRKGFLQPEQLRKWEEEGTLLVTPSRRINNRNVAADDDRYVIQCAAAMDGIIVTTDQYRNHFGINKLWDEAIEKRLLMLTWLGDLLIFPDDPLGRNGPKLKDFLKY